MPREGSPTIHVNVRTIRTEEDRKREIERMWSEHAAETERAEAEAASSSEEDKEQPLHGATKYDLGASTTMEYDVVKCEDFVEEKGCWVKNMPEEIKLANPNFVPS